MTRPRRCRPPSGTSDVRPGWTRACVHPGGRPCPPTGLRKRLPPLPTEPSPPSVRSPAQVVQSTHALGVLHEPRSPYRAHRPRLRRRTRRVRDRCRRRERGGLPHPGRRRPGPAAAAPPRPGHLPHRPPPCRWHGRRVQGVGVQRPHPRRRHHARRAVDGLPPVPPPPRPRSLLVERRADRVPAGAAARPRRTPDARRERRPPVRLQRHQRRLHRPVSRLGLLGARARRPRLARLQRGPRVPRRRHRLPPHVPAIRLRRRRDARVDRGPGPPAVVAAPEHVRVRRPRVAAAPRPACGARPQSRPPDPRTRHDPGAPRLLRHRPARLRRPEPGRAHSPPGRLGRLHAPRLARPARPALRQDRGDVLPRAERIARRHRHVQARPAARGRQAG